MALAYWAGGALGNGVDVGILAPAVVVRFLRGEAGQKPFRKSGLGRRLDHGNGAFVELQHIRVALGAQVAAAQQLKDPVSDVGKAQVGDGIDFILGQIHLKIVFQKRFPRFSKNWAQSPGNSPVTMPVAIITGR